MATSHLTLLRRELKHQKLDGFIVPRADEHQGEFVPPSAERLAWVSGFTGSAGSAVVLAGKAALFTDGRYTLQAKGQVDGKSFETLDSTNHSPADWLGDQLRAGQKLGYDPWLHTKADIARIKSVCDRKNAKLIAVRQNPIDNIWQDRPPPPKGKIAPHPLRLTGRSAQDKLKELAKTLKAEDQDACILTLPDSIAWVFNIRGSDIAFMPVVLAFAIIKQSGKAELFIDPDKVDKTAKAYLSTFARVFNLKDLPAHLKMLGQKKACVRLDDNSAAIWFANTLKKAGAKPIHGSDPCRLPKAIKTSAEIKGAKAAHMRDGVALCRFLSWLERESPKGQLDEIKVADKLEFFRAQSDAFKSPSFPTISAAGPNGAIVHYRTVEKTNRKLKSGSLYLNDSGAQYPDGTTDVTRTIAIGKPSTIMRKHFTLVLKGHIALAMAHFARGRGGAHLDALARLPLWQEGLDYDHGTGHGIGSYLSVHEGPVNISSASYNPAIAPGMILSNEPGFYRAGHYGIRIENLVLVMQHKTKGNPRKILRFETLTLAPIDRKLIIANMLSADELKWLDNYHAQVNKQIGPKLDKREKAWLKKACAVIK